MKRISFLLTMPILCMALTAMPAIAGPGHDHGEEAFAGQGAASPRFEAHSDLFEAIGILKGQHLSLFVDRFTDNAPILNAKVEIESGTMKAVGIFHEDHGDYEFVATPFQKAGSYPITLTVTSGDVVDVLAANLVVAEEHAGHEHGESSWLEQAGWWALGALVLIALVRVARQLMKRRNTGTLS